MTYDKKYRTLVLTLLTLLYAFNFIDRQIVGILAPFFSEELGLSNTQIGLLTGLAFAFLYTLVGIPLAWVADRFNRVNLISAALATWSGFTALTGFAGNFTQMALARMGVGIGEAGGSPPAHSIISDLYPKEKRASALAVYSLGIPFGIMFAYFTTAALLGKPGEAVPWRKIFFILGGLGIGLAIVLRLVLREPVRGAQERLKSGKSVDKTPFFEALTTLLSIPAWWAMCLGIASASFVGYAFNAFQTKYLVPLDPEFNLKTLMIWLGVINGLCYGAGTYFGARVTDYFGAKNVRAYGFIPAITIAIACPLAITSFWVGTVPAHLAVVSVFVFFLGVYLGPSFAIAQTLAPIHMRAMSTAIFFFILNMIAMGLGPTFTGIMADMFAKTHDSVHAVRLAITVTSLGLLVSAGFFLWAAYLMPKDWANAQARNEGIAVSK